MSLSAPALTHSVSTTFIEYRCQPPGRGGGGAATPAVQLNSIFSAKTDPRENPEKTPERTAFMGGGGVKVLNKRTIECII